jgi:hypothetical protein
MAVWSVLPGGRVKRFQNRQTRCRCGKSRKGRPRVGYGMCHGHEEAQSRTARRQFRAELLGVERDQSRWETIRCSAPHVEG